MSKQKISNRLQSLDELEWISVEVTGGTNGTIRITHERHHAPEFMFRWSSDHFLGYFIDGDGCQSQAVVSLRTSMDAIRFVAAYSILNEIRANQKSS